MAMLRRIALNVVRQHPRQRHSIRIRRLIASWDEAYLLQLLREIWMRWPCSYVAAARRSAIGVVDWSGPLRGPALVVLRPVHVVGDGSVDLVVGEGDDVGPHRIASGGESGRIPAHEQGSRSRDQLPTEPRGPRVGRWSP
jgi:hypothetical protein